MRLAERYNLRARQFGCRQQLICVGFVHLTWREGLRDIEKCLRAKGPAALYDLGPCEPVARVSLPRANEQRGRRLWKDLTTHLIALVKLRAGGLSFGQADFRRSVPQPSACPCSIFRGASAVRPKQASSCTHNSICSIRLPCTPNVHV